MMEPDESLALRVDAEEGMSRQSVDTQRFDDEHLPEWPDAPVMLIDDDEQWTALLAQSLRRLGWREVRILTDPAYAVELIREFEPAVVLLDLRLADRSGLDVLSAMDALDQRPPVIMVTCVDQLEMAVVCMQHGASDYLTKPLSKTKLVRALVDVLARPGQNEPSSGPQSTRTIEQLEQLPILKDVKDVLIEEALRRCRGVLKDAAAMLGVTPQAICNHRRRHQEHNVDAE